jgi:prevent-host-death family protein
LRFSGVPVGFVDMPILDIEEARAHLSRLIDRVLAGEEVILARAGTPVARLVPYKAA